MAIGLAGIAVAARVAYAAYQITVNTPIAVSDGIMGDKPKLQRAGDGTLVVAYGDSPDGAGMVYDVKAAENAQRQHLRQDLQAGNSCGQDL